MDTAEGDLGVASPQRLPVLAATSKRGMRRDREGRSATFAREAVAEGGRSEREVIALGKDFRL